MHGTDRWNSFGLLVWIKANTLHPISLRWDTDGFSPNQSSYGVLPLMDEEAVKLVRYADVAENSCHDQSPCTSCPSPYTSCPHVFRLPFPTCPLSLTRLPCVDHEVAIPDSSATPTPRASCVYKMTVTHRTSSKLVLLWNSDSSSLPFGVRPSGI